MHLRQHPCEPDDEGDQVRVASGRFLFDYRKGADELLLGEAEMRLRIRPMQHYTYTTFFIGREGRGAGLCARQSLFEQRRLGVDAAHPFVILDLVR